MAGTTLLHDAVNLVEGAAFHERGAKPAAREASAGSEQGSFPNVVRRRPRIRIAAAATPLAAVR
jgi:hypothetical protein